jgi:hypothetical protein
MPEARFIHTQGRNGEPVRELEEGKNGRRPNFWSFWPNEVPKKPS